MIFFIRHLPGVSRASVAAWPRGVLTPWYDRSRSEPRTSPSRSPCGAPLSCYPSRRRPPGADTPGRGHHETMRRRGHHPADPERRRPAARRRVHQPDRHQGGVGRRLDVHQLHRRLARPLRRAVPAAGRRLPGRRHARHHRVGHRQVPRPHPAGAGDVLARRQHQRAPGLGRRDHVRRPRRAGKAREEGGGGLRLADVHRARAGEDGARGDQGDDRPRHGVRLRLRGRVVLGGRPERGVDPRDDRQGRRRHGRAVGRGAHPRRDDLGAREPVPHPPLPAQRPAELPLREGRHLVRPRQGLVQGEGRGVLVRRRLRAGRLRQPARVRGAGVEHVPARRALGEPRRSTTPRACRRRCRSRSSPTGSSPSPTRWRSCATTSRGPRST